MTFDNALLILVIAWGIIGILALIMAMIMVVVVFVKTMKGIR